MFPRAGAGREIPTTWVPSEIRHAIVVPDADLLDASTPLALRRVLATCIVCIKVEVPELEL
jgi:hypothetical protein